LLLIHCCDDNALICVSASMSISVQNRCAVSLRNCVVWFWDIDIH